MGDAVRRPRREDFVADLLAALAELALPIGDTRGARSTKVIRRAVGDDPRALRTAPDRRRALLAAVAASADDDLVADRAQRERWRLFLTLALAVPTLPAGRGREQVADAVAAAEDAVLNRIERSYQTLIEMFGFTSTISYRALAQIGIALMRGYVVGSYAGSSAGTPGAAYAVLVDGVANASDESRWSTSRAQALIDRLATADAFEEASSS